MQDVKGKRTTVISQRVNNHYNLNLQSIVNLSMNILRMQLFSFTVKV